ncbi:MAG: D-alanine--D-alanine ligase [bacterium]|nr:D-alanine--D-alanine ligase [bacterium]
MVGFMRIALVFGGRSGEHDVSVVSARAVWRGIDCHRHEVLPMAVDRSGRWANADTSWRVLEQSKDRADEVLSFEGAQRLDSRLIEEKIDVVIPMLHGPFGEDGVMQGLFEALDLPYVGCDHSASAVCMDKALTKRLIVQAGLPTGPWVETDRYQWKNDPNGVRARAKTLALPLFVKPARLGSSVGISRVGSLDDLDRGVEIALNHDDRLVIEAGIDAREIEIAVLGNEEPRASIPGEVVPGDTFYSYEDKYLDDSCQLLAPAPVSEDEAVQARRLATEAFAALGCSGMARVDLFLERSSNDFLINEVNTIPGFTPISMYPRLWQLTGLDFPELLEELMQLALRRHGLRSGSRLNPA